VEIDFFDTLLKIRFGVPRQVLAVFLLLNKMMCDSVNYLLMNINTTELVKKISAKARLTISGKPFARQKNNHFFGRIDFLK